MRGTSLGFTRILATLLITAASAGCFVVRPDQVNKDRPGCTFDVDLKSFKGDYALADALNACIVATAAAGCDGMAGGINFIAILSPSPTGNPPTIFPCRGYQCEPSSATADGDGGTKVCKQTLKGSDAGPAVERAVATAAATIPASEREALIAIYEGTAGATYWYSSARTNWLGPAGSECSWAGVACDEAGEHVTALAFENSGLYGQLPEEIGDLPLLEVLIVHNAEGLSGPLPNALGDLGRLRMLSLQQTMISGGLPPALGSLPNLRVLRIVSSDLSGQLPSALGSLGQLAVLQINASRISGSIPPSLGGLGELLALDLRLNELSGPIPAELGNLAKLEALMLGWNDLSGPIPSSLGGLAKLKELNLAHNRLSGAVPAGLGGLAELLGLTLDANDLTGPLPDSLGGLAKLIDLSAGFNALSGPLPAWLPNLAPTLEILYLPDNQLSGPLSDLSALSNLTDLHLAWNAFDPAPVPAWLAAEAVSKLAKVDLSRTQRTGAFPNFSGLPLTHLAIGENAFDPGPVPEWIAAETTLEHLDLRGTGRTGDIPSFLTQLESLTALFLSDNAFTPGPIPGFFNATEMPSLSSLTLDGTQRTGSIPPALFTLPLSTLRLARNQLSGPIPKEVRDPLIHVLDLSHNQLSGPLPEELGTQIRMESLRLNGNKFTGKIPEFYKSSLIDDDMVDGTVSDDFGRVFPGIDLRHNALETSDPEMVELIEQKSEDGEDFQETQTVAPTDLKAAASGKNVKLSWTAIAFSDGPGGYTIEVGTKAKGPFLVAGTTKNKTVTSFTVKKLKPKTQYYFRLRTTSAAQAENLNELISAPGAVVKFKTK